jgi:hypothetical protein
MASILRIENTPLRLFWKIPSQIIILSEGNAGEMGEGNLAVCKTVFTPQLADHSWNDCQSPGHCQIHQRETSATVLYLHRILRTTQYPKPNSTSHSTYQGGMQHEKPSKHPITTHTNEGRVWDRPLKAQLSETNGGWRLGAMGTCLSIKEG